MNGKDLLPQGTESERTIMFNFENESERKEEAATPTEADVNTEIQDNQERTVPLPSSEEGVVAVPSKGKRASAEILDYLEIFVLSITMVLILFTFCARLCRVDGESMKNSFEDGQMLIISDLFYTPDNGDVIVFHQTEGFQKPLVKRVIATGGQEVVINFATKEIRVDGELYKDSHAVLKNFSDVIINRYTLFPEHNYDVDQKIFSATVPEGHIFVMGDNRNNSKDSRDPGIGFVDERCVLGKAIIRIFPFTIFP